MRKTLTAIAGLTSLVLATIPSTAAAGVAELHTVVSYYGTITQWGIGSPFYVGDHTGEAAVISINYRGVDGVYSSSGSSKNWDGPLGGGFFFTGGGFGFGGVGGEILDGNAGTISIFIPETFGEQLTATFDPVDGVIPSDLKAPFSSVGSGTGRFEINYFNVLQYAEVRFDRIEITQTLVPDGVPEPASWALMIIGFYSTGVALRRRSRVNQGRASIL